MSDSKYEIRSKEVQKMMNTPINKRLLWGSTFMLLLLLAGSIAFNSVVITEYKNGMLYIKDLADSNKILASVKNTDTSNSLHKKIYIDTKPETIEGTIEQIVPLNAFNSTWLIRSDSQIPAASNSPQIVSYRMIYRKKSMFAYIKKHFGL